MASIATNAVCPTRHAFRKLGRPAPSSEHQLIKYCYLQNTNCDELQDDTGVTKNHVLPQGHTACPSWLGAVAPNAQINTKVLQIFESFKDKDQCLAEVMQSVTGTDA